MNEEYEESHRKQGLKDSTVSRRELLKNVIAFLAALSVLPVTDATNAFAASGEHEKSAQGAENDPSSNYHLEPHCNIKGQCGSKGSGGIYCPDCKGALVDYGLHNASGVALFVKGLYQIGTVFASQTNIIEILKDLFELKKDIEDAKANGDPPPYVLTAAAIESYAHNAVEEFCDGDGNVNQQRRMIVAKFLYDVVGGISGANLEFQDCKMMAHYFIFGSEEQGC